LFRDEVALREVASSLSANSSSLDALHVEFHPKKDDEDVDFASEEEEVSGKSANASENLTQNSFRTDFSSMDRESGKGDSLSFLPIKQKLLMLPCVIMRKEKKRKRGLGL
jgi:hypothetical protein